MTRRGGTMHKKIWVLGLALASATALAGCGSSRDVEVTGQVTAPASAQGEIVVEFFEVSDSGPTSVHSATLASPGAFSEKVPLEGDSVLIRAIGDADGDGKCTAGELWDEIEVSIADDDTAKDALLTLAAGPCPTD